MNVTSAAVVELNKLISARLPNHFKTLVRINLAHNGTVWFIAKI